MVVNGGHVYGHTPTLCKINESTWIGWWPFPSPFHFFPCVSWLLMCGYFDVYLSAFVGVTRTWVRVWNLYVRDNGRHPYGWLLGSGGNNGKGPLSCHPSFSESFIACRCAAVTSYVLCSCVRANTTKENGMSCPTNQDLSLLRGVMNA